MNIIVAIVLDLIAVFGFVWIAGTSPDDFSEDNNIGFWIRMAILSICCAMVASATALARG